MAAGAAQRGVALGVPPPPARHPTRACPAVVQQPLPARLPGEGARPGAALPILLSARLHPHRAVRDHVPDRHLPDVLLHPVGRVGLRRHAAAPHRDRLRPARPQRPPLVGAPDGAGGGPAPRPGVLRRRLQAAAAVQLGPRGRPAPRDARVVVQRLPAAMGPAQLLGGAQIGQATLLRFYALHVVVLPLALTGLLALHIWRVRKDGFAVQQPTSGAFAEEATELASGPAVPIAGGADVGEQRVRLLGVVDRESVTAEERRVDDTVFTWPHLLVRHVVVGLATAAVVLTLGVAFAAPLRGLANPNLTPEPSKAPWYFVGLQELLSHVDPLVAILGLALLPYLDRNPATEARNRKVAVLLFATLLVIATALTIIGVFFRGPGWRFVPPWRHLYVEL